MLMRNNDLIGQLSLLTMEEKCLKRNLDKYYNDVDERRKMFNKLRENKKKVEQIKFKIRLEREMKNNEK